MKILTILRRRAAYLLAVAVVFACQVAEACPGCRQAVGGDGSGGSYNTNSVALGYALSIGFLLFMIATSLSTLGYFAYRNCRILAARQRMALQEEEDGGLGAGVRA